MKFSFRALSVLAAMAVSVMACQTAGLETLGPEDRESTSGHNDPAGAIIPQETDALPKVYIETPGKQGVSGDKSKWTENCSITVTAIISGEEKTLYQDDGLKIRGRGNSTWASYPKKPYRFTLRSKTNLIGTGKSKKWVLLANWMDRTLLRNDVAFEAARRTGLEWTPSGIFVEFYLDGNHLGNYWLGEMIDVDSSRFLAQYLYEYNSSGGSFVTQYGYWKNAEKKNGGIPVTLEYPDWEDEADPQALLSDAQDALYAGEDIIYTFNWKSGIDIVSFADWFIVNELVQNTEPRHPKSSFFYIRNGILHAGPVWDFDWSTFTRASYYERTHRDLNLTQTLYYARLFENKEFKDFVKQRWRVLKPGFETLGEYIDNKANRIRESEAVNHQMWPCYPNPLSYEEGLSGEINFDEKMSFQDAVNSMKMALIERISYMDAAINAL